MLDDDFARAFKRRFANRPEWNRPDLWPIITDPKRALQRRWLSDVISGLGEAQRRNVLERLQSNRHFLATYNELAVTALLCSSGLAIEYEPSFSWRHGALTPDLALCLPGGDLVALVEVSTKFRTAEQRSQEVQWKELRTRVGRIPCPVGLLVKDLRSDLSRPPESGQARRIESALRAWLLLPTTTLGATCEVEGYWFQVAGPLPGLRAQVATPTGTDWYNTDMVRKAISVKVSRYAELADSLEVPLVVVLAAEPAMPLSLEMLRSVLAGARSLAIALDPFMVSQASSGPMRLNERDVPAEFNPALSLVGWLQPGVDEPGSLTVFDVQRTARRFSAPLGEHVVREMS